MSKKILVVEDAEDNRRILRDLLSMAGYDMIEAHDGAEGVAKASEHKPDLILDGHPDAGDGRLRGDAAHQG